ncbi:MAG TPA: GlsB/YeaQ/YmgE family stress response membrane protein [Dehalococcoidia bacterium]|nr:GlsB/YeaQ/YmgE family stress response membrane protein [Dehalococcoidia bacterium]
MSLDNTNIEEIVIWLVVGVAAGWLASQIMRSKRGLISYALLGIVGAIVGGFLFSALDIGGATNVLGQIVIATVGAVLVLAVVGR